MTIIATFKKKAQGKILKILQIHIITKQWKEEDLWAKNCNYHT